MDALEAIETRDSRDMDSLGSLQRHVNQVRTLAGCKPFTEDDFRFTNLHLERDSDAWIDFD